VKENTSLLGNFLFHHLRTTSTPAPLSQPLPTLNPACILISSTSCISSRFGLYHISLHRALNGANLVQLVICSALAYWLKTERNGLAFPAFFIWSSKSQDSNQSVSCSIPLSHTNGNAISCMLSIL